jgi:hypothetical protein
LKTCEISSADFLAGVRPFPRGIGTHNLKAELVGRGIEVKDPSGKVVEVSYGATMDRRSVHAYVTGLGFIGGWQWPHRSAPFTDLVESINQGVLYHDMNSLPNGRKRKV